MHWVTCIRGFSSTPVATILLSLFLGGCGEEAGIDGDWVTSLESTSRNLFPAPEPENLLDPVPLGDHASVVGYTLKAGGGLAPGSVVDATLSFRSTKKQDGEFQLTIELLGDGKELDTAATFVSTPRWPRQKDFLEEGEPFWGTVSLRLPLGIRSEVFEVIATLGEVDPESGEVRPIPPTIRFVP